MLVVMAISAVHVQGGWHDENDVCDVCCVRWCQLRNKTEECASLEENVRIQA